MRVVFVCPSSTVADFMLRVARAMPHDTTLFLCMRPGTALYVCARGQPAQWVRSAEEPTPQEPIEVFLARQAPYEWARKRGSLNTPGRLRRFARAVNGASIALASALSHFDPDLIVIWNSEEHYCRVSATFARNHRATAVHLEVGFFHDTIFLDTAGVNRRSTASKLPLETMRQRRGDSHSEVSVQWRGARFMNPATPWHRILRLCERVVNRAHYLINALVQGPQVSLAGRPAWRVISDPWRLAFRQLARRFKQRPRIPDRYVLIPLQVSTDTQVLVNSLDFPDLVSFVRFCLRWIPKELGIVVTPHPAEPIAPFHRVIQAEARHRPGALWVDWVSTAELLTGCTALVTLNSAVGLEALSRMIPTFVLAEAMYRRTGLGVAIGLADGTRFHSLLRDTQTAKPDRDCLDALMHYLTSELHVPGNVRALVPEHAQRIADKLRQLHLRTLNDKMAVAQTPNHSQSEIPH